MGKPLLAYEGVQVLYGGRVAVRDFSASVEAGEVLCIVGESGSGKSTLVKAAMGLLGPRGVVSEGRIVYEGSDLARMPSRELRRLCGSQLGLVFQDCLAALTPIRTIGSQLFEPMRFQTDLSRQEVEERACSLLSRMNVKDPKRVLGSYPFELSGGIGQRVGIAMAMVPQPRVLFADEPTSALDAVSQKQVVDEMRALKDRSGTAVVLVTHNIGVARALADRIVVLKDGTVVEEGAACDVLSRPRSEFTKELLAAVPTIAKGSC